MHNRQSICPISRLMSGKLWHNMICCSFLCATLVGHWWSHSAWWRENSDTRTVVLWGYSCISWYWRWIWNHRGMCCSSHSVFYIWSISAADGIEQLQTVVSNLAAAIWQWFVLELANDYTGLHFEMNFMRIGVWEPFRDNFGALISKLLSESPYVVKSY